MKLKAGEMTERMQAFVDEFDVDYNPTAAARRAGYSDAAGEARRLMHHPTIQRALKLKKLQRAKTCELEAAHVTTALATMLRFSLKDVIDEEGNFPENLNDLPDYAAECVKSVKLKRDGEGKLITADIEFINKEEILKLAMERFGMREGGTTINNQMVFDFDALYGPLPAREVDPIEARLKAVEGSTNGE